MSAIASPDSSYVTVNQFNVANFTAIKSTGPMSFLRFLVSGKKEKELSKQAKLNKFGLYLVMHVISFTYRGFSLVQEYSSFSGWPILERYVQQ